MQRFAMKSSSKYFFFAIVMVILLAVTSCAQAEENQSPLAQETKAIVDAAYELVLEHSDNMELVQRALLNDPRFSDHQNELHIFMHCYREGAYEAICCGHGRDPELIGKDMWNLRTPSGRLLFHEIREIVDQDGQGWIEYEWLNTYSNTLRTKRSYFRGIVLSDGRRAWVGCGYWKD